MARSFAWLALFAAVPHPLVAETTDRQTFLVSVPARLKIVAPAIDPVEQGEPVDGVIRFERQVWQVGANTHAGAVIVFQTEGAFQFVGDPTVQRDARLDLSVVSHQGPGQWIVTRASDATNYRQGADQAQVAVRSNQSGSAEIGLSVTFLADDEANLPGGDYVTTVVGTITAE